MPDSKDDRLILDWQEVGLSPGRSRRRRRDGGRTRTVVLSSVILGLLIAPFGIAATGDVLREGVRNGTTAKETEIIGKFNATTGAKGGYVTRQSNTQTGPNAGGGAIYGCRGAAGGTAGGSAPCLRASNLADGLAFEFASKSGPAGLFEVASATDAPFATNGGGLVTNLNADKVDGLDAADLKGATGPAGPQGERGPSDAREAYRDTGALGPAPPEPILRIESLPAGSYAITAVLGVRGGNGTGSPQSLAASCRIMSGGLELTSAQIVKPVAPTSFVDDRLPLQATAQLDDTADLTLDCHEFGSSAHSIIWGTSLIATQLDNVERAASTG